MLASGSLMFLPLGGGQAWGWGVACTFPVWSLQYQLSGCHPTPCLLVVSEYTQQKHSPHHERNWFGICESLCKWTHRNLSFETTSRPDTGQCEDHTLSLSAVLQSPWESIQTCWSVSKAPVNFLVLPLASLCLPIDTHCTNVPSFYLHICFHCVQHPPPNPASWCPGVREEPLTGSGAGGHTLHWLLLSGRCCAK